MNKWHLGILILSLIPFSIGSVINIRTLEGKEFPVPLNKNMPLQKVLLILGDSPPPHALDSISPMLIKQGEELVLNGQTIDNQGNKSPFISKFYVCTDCHNIVQEDPDLRESNPVTRLDYALKNELPFLQGTTMKGVVNRESWYNGDYEKKYGKLVEEARHSLAGAIQLCAQECAQGRKLANWEVEAITAYFWSLEYTLADLQVENDLINRIERAELNPNPQTNQELIAELKSYYLQASPATFSEAPTDKFAGYATDSEGNAKNGEAIYRLACQTCHKPNGVSRYLLDDAKFTFRKLKRNIPKDSKHSLYQIIRYGTYAQPGARPYMPLYTLERMSHQQIEDLRVYIERESL